MRTDVIHGFRGDLIERINRVEAELRQVREDRESLRKEADMAIAEVAKLAAEKNDLRSQLADNDLAFAHAKEMTGKYMKYADDEIVSLRSQLAAAQRERDELLSRYAFGENQRLCVGYKEKCNGDLEGIAHKETCPAREKDEILRPHLYQTLSDQYAAKEGK